jgi:hypothetical protein
MILRALQNTPLNVGNMIAWLIMALCVGFALGWVANAERMYSFCPVP